MRIVLVVISLTMISLSAYAGQEDRSTFQSGITSDFASGTPGAITAELLRNNITDLSDSCYFLDDNDASDITFDPSGLSNTDATDVQELGEDLDAAMASIDGENIQDDTIDDDSIDFSDVTLADFSFDVGSVDTTEFGYLNGVTSSVQTQLDAKASDTGQSFQITGFLEAPTEKTYRLVVDSEFAFTIVETTTDATSGTCTATFNINGTPLGGTANSVSSTEESQAQASANSVAVGDDLNLVISSNSSCVDVVFKVGYTRAFN